MHGVWFEDAYYFSTGATTRKAKNLEQNAHSVVINERLDELVIVEGQTAMLPATVLPKGLATEYLKKYGWELDPRGAVFKLTPRAVFAIPEKQFATACTRWKFDLGARYFRTLPNATGPRNRRSGTAGISPISWQHCRNSCNPA